MVRSTSISHGSGSLLIADVHSGVFTSKNSFRVSMKCLFAHKSAVRPLVQEMCSKISEKPDSALLAKTRKFGNRSLRVVLTKSAWSSVLGHLSVPTGLTGPKAREPSWYYPCGAACRLPGSSSLFSSARKSHGNGEVPRRRHPPPFGHPRYEFSTPNP
jgi:hypothetical protein